MRISRKFIIASVLILMSMVAMLLPASVAVAADEVSFPDDALREEIRVAIGGGDITQANLALLTDFIAAGKGIKDLTGMEYCTSLEKLGLIGNQISDLSPLSNLTSLTWLWAGVNKISDVSPLSNLTNLVHVELYQNDISDISALSELTSLDFLWLQHNQISDISILSKFTKLYDLDISYNQIIDIKPLVDNPGLCCGDWVTLWFNPLNPVSIDDYIPQLEARGVEVFYIQDAGCFIATAAYGTSTAYEIDTLRAFRDEVLLESTLGAQLVEWYYQASPPVADFISENSLLRTLVRELLVEPVARVVEATAAIWRD